MLEYQHWGFKTDYHLVLIIDISTRNKNHLYYFTITRIFEVSKRNHAKTKIVIQKIILILIRLVVSNCRLAIDK